jgi:DNA-binding transcriptional ArsR family regulator
MPASKHRRRGRTRPRRTFVTPFPAYAAPEEAIAWDAYTALYEHPWGRQAKEWDWATRQPRRHGGVIGRTGCLVYGAILAASLNGRTDQVELSYAEIAEGTGVSHSTVATAIRRLRELGVLTWRVRGRQSNLFTLLPPEQWRVEGGLPPAPRIDQAAG